VKDYIIVEVSLKRREAKTWGQPIRQSSRCGIRSP